MCEIFDVVIPIKSTNSLVLDNLNKISKFESVNRILIGDAGIDANLLSSILQVPKVRVIDQRNLLSLGFSIKKLIELVKTRYFAYLHADVELPHDWFKVMRQHMNTYDFAECARVHDYSYQLQDGEKYIRKDDDRPLSGAQMGRKEVVLAAIDCIEDDYLFRNEDIIIADLVKERGGRYGCVNDTYHIHQMGYSRINEHISKDDKLIIAKSLKKSDLKIFENQVNGLIKYIKPKNKYHIWHFDYSIAVIDYLGGSRKSVEFELKKSNSLMWNILYISRPFRIFRMRLIKAIKIMAMPQKDLLEH